MSFEIHMLGSLVPESYSRQLDERVMAQEMPYGYVTQAPLFHEGRADSGDFDQERLETTNQYPKRRGRAI
jgi:hypothetical protein